jgi:Spy/CpxP family protein refolding chaperone
MKDHHDLFIITRRRDLMKKRILILSTVGVVVLGAAFAVGASKSHSGWCGSHDGGQRKIDRIAEKLDLNETQKAKLQAVQESFQEVRLAMSQARVQTFNEALDLISSETLDQSRVQSIVKRHQSIVEDFTPKVTAKIADFHAVLSQDQKSNAAEFLQKWKDRFEERRETHT